MNRFKVLFLPHAKEIEVKQGSRLIRAAMDAGVHVNASCGGEGVCGKCRVLIEQGEIEDGISEKLSRDDVMKGYRLACQSIVKSDVTIRIPVESEIDKTAIRRFSAPRKKAGIQEMDLSDLKEQGLFMPPMEKKYLELPAPDAADHLPDVTRLVSFLKVNHDEHRLVVEFPVIRKLPDLLRQADFKVTATLARPVQKGRKSSIISVEGGDTTDRNYGIAMDIGTTTIYGQLLNLSDGKVLASFGDFNGQISYGEDVISRIVYAERPEGLEKLHEVVVQTINGLIRKLFKSTKIGRDEVSVITLAGNTTMTQLLLKVTPKYIRRSPYVPAATLYPPIKAVDIGLELGDHVNALVYPAVSSYVGGDIVAGVMGSGMYRTEKMTLFMDIGTNAEIVIGNRDFLACAACSAGPAFEGGGIAFGMRAAKGAIEDFSINPVTLDPMNITIGNVRPRGISGSGLITMVAALFEMGVLDNAGKFNRNLNTPRIRETNGVVEYVLAWKDDTQIDRDITLSEIDIENLIRAKGAIYSGCMTLLSEVGMDFSDVEHIILAGGFGTYVDLEKAMTIGLLPEFDTENIIFVGNGSLLGAKMSCLTNRLRFDVVEVTKKMTNFELSETSSYMDHYIASLFLPHTDIDRFPKLKKRLQDRKLMRQ
jgi:uncharacterized 2Fe-2S/4Fe-4S cluster protein (DUF4445 family)